MNPTMRHAGSALSLALRDLLFTLVIAVSGAVLAPRWILTRFHATAAPTVWPVIVIRRRRRLYLWCVWLFASMGRGTPGPWDAPRQLVAAGPYKWVRDPIQVSALLVVPGEAAVPFAIAARLRGRDGDRLPPVRGRPRGADAAPSVRRRLLGTVHRWIPAAETALRPARWHFSACFNHVARR